MKQIIRIVLFSFFCIAVNAQVLTRSHQIADGDAFHSIPQEWSFTNSLEVRNEGGHLQGIQICRLKDRQYYFLSGSSDLYSYMVMVDQEEQKVSQMQKLFDKPFKHAGGFQVHDQYLMVGVEDNDLRTRSKLCVYRILGEEGLEPAPLVTIERTGEYERATAGCVAFSRVNSLWLTIVGDWNTRHLDFYVSEAEDIRSGFTLVESLSTLNMDRTGWSDEQWLPYQNINLYVSQQGLFLIGMTSYEGKNTVDIYRLLHQDLRHFRLEKETRILLENTGGDFIWGAGIDFDNDIPNEIFSCERNLRDKNMIYRYTKK